MRILIDTNVLISAALNTSSTPYLAYVKAASYPNHGLICEQNGLKHPNIMTPAEFLCLNAIQGPEKM